MPLRYLNYKPPEPQVELPAKPQYLGPPPSRVGYKGSNEFLRTPANWYSIMERSYQEAISKLKSVLKTDLHVDPAPLDSIVPCIVDIEEGRTREEKERIRRAHRKAATVFAHFFDRLVRYRPESRLFAFDNLTQDFQDSKILWAPYECTRFRPAVQTMLEKGPAAAETEAKKPRKAPTPKQLEARRKFAEMARAKKSQKSLG